MITTFDKVECYLVGNGDLLALAFETLFDKRREEGCGESWSCKVGMYAGKRMDVGCIGSWRREQREDVIQDLRNESLSSERETSNGRLIRFVRTLLRKARVNSPSKTASKT